MGRARVLLNVTAIPNSGAGYSIESFARSPSCISLSNLTALTAVSVNEIFSLLHLELSSFGGEIVPCGDCHENIV